MVEYQTRIIGPHAEKEVWDVPLEATDSGYAMLKANKALFFIRDKCNSQDAANNTHLDSLVEVVRHDTDFIEQRPIWQYGLGYLDNKKGNQ